MENDSRKIIRRLKADGWTLVRTKGSHHHFKHPEKPEILTIKHPDRDLTPGLVHEVYKKAGWADSDTKAKSKDRSRKPLPKKRK